MLLFWVVEIFEILLRICSLGGVARHSYHPGLTDKCRLDCEGTTE